MITFYHFHILENPLKYIPSKSLTNLVHVSTFPQIFCSYMCTCTLSSLTASLAIGHVALEYTSDATYDCTFERNCAQVNSIPNIIHLYPMFHIKGITGPLEGAVGWTASVLQRQCKKIFQLLPTILWCATMMYYGVVVVVVGGLWKFRMRAAL